MHANADNLFGTVKKSYSSDVFPSGQKIGKVHVVNEKNQDSSYPRTTCFACNTLQILKKQKHEKLSLL